jgi:hypothetical protein
MSGYALTRNTNPLVVILPFGIITLVIHNFDDYGPGHGWALPIVIFLSLVLLGRLVFAQYLVDWKARRIFAAPDARIFKNLAGSGGSSCPPGCPLPNNLNRTLAWRSFGRFVTDLQRRIEFRMIRDEMFLRRALHRSHRCIGEMPIFTQRSIRSIRRRDITGAGVYDTIRMVNGTTSRRLRTSLNRTRYPSTPDGNRLHCANVTVEFSCRHSSILLRLC